MMRWTVRLSSCRSYPLEFFAGNLPGRVRPEPHVHREISTVFLQEYCYVPQCTYNGCEVYI